MNEHNWQFTKTYIWENKVMVEIRCFACDVVVKKEFNFDDVKCIPARQMMNAVAPIIGGTGL